MQVRKGCRDIAVKALSYLQSPILKTEITLHIPYISHYIFTLYIHIHVWKNINVHLL